MRDFDTIFAFSHKGMKQLFAIAAVVSVSFMGVGISECGMWNVVLLKCDAPVSRLSCMLLIGGARSLVLGFGEGPCQGTVFGLSSARRARDESSRLGLRLRLPRFWLVRQHWCRPSWPQPRALSDASS
jgi:hypothetical protein